MFLFQPYFFIVLTHAGSTRCLCASHNTLLSVCSVLRCHFLIAEPLYLQKFLILCSNFTYPLGLDQQHASNNTNPKESTDDFLLPMWWFGFSVGTCSTCLPALSWPPCSVLSFKVLHSAHSKAWKITSLGQKE